MTGRKHLYKPIRFLYRNQVSVTRELLSELGGIGGRATALQQLINCCLAQLRVPHKRCNASLGSSQALARCRWK